MNFKNTAALLMGVLWATVAVLMVAAALFWFGVAAALWMALAMILLAVVGGAILWVGPREALTTVVLVVLAAACAALFLVGPTAARWLHLSPQPPNPAGAGTLAVLQDELAPDRVTRIDVQQGDRHVVLERGKDGWTLAGKWPARKAEVEQLVDRLTRLRSRFVPIPLSGDPPDLARYGLDRPAVTVTLRTSTGDYRLDFSVEPGETNRFSRPTYARLTQRGEAEPEVVRLDPGLVADLERPLDYYYKRGLFVPSEGAGAKVANAIKVNEPANTYTLTRAGDDWDLTYPVSGKPTAVHDRPDPDRLKDLLKAVPDIWAERFVENRPVHEAAFPVVSLSGQAPSEAALADVVWSYLACGALNKERVEKAGVPAALLAGLPLAGDGVATQLARALPARLAFLDDENRRQMRLGFFSPVRISVTRSDGDVVTLLIGGERSFDLPGSPAHTSRYARLVGNDQLFEVKDGSFQSLLTSGESLRDERLTRFETKDVERIEVDLPDQQLVLVHTKEKVKSGDKGEEREEDRWRMEKPLQGDADAFLVSDLLNDLSNLRIQFGDIHYQVEPQKDGLDRPAATVRLTIRETKGEGPNKTTATKLVAVRFGKPVQDKTYVAVEGRDVITSVTGPVVTAANRKGIDLIKRDLLTVDTKNIQSLKKTGSDEDLTLQKDDTGTWQIQDVPVPAFKPQSQAVDTLLGVWANLRAERYVSYGTTEDLKKYGLDRPAVTVTISVKPEGGTGTPVTHKLYLGKPVESPIPAAALGSLPWPGLPVNLVLAALSQEKQKDLLPSSAGGSDERYARLDDRSGVFVLGGFTAKELKRTYLDFVDATVLKFEPDQVRALLRQMGREKLEVDKGDTGWEVVLPAKQRADDKTLDDLVTQMAKLKATRVAAYPPKDLKAFGLENPVAIVKLRLAEPAGKMLELHIGKPANDHDPLNKDDRFAQTAGSPMVVVIPGNVAKRLVAGPLEFRDRTLPTFREADGVVLERGPRRATFAKVDGTWKLTSPVAAAADHDKLEDFVNKISRLRVDEWVTANPAERKAYGLDQPQARWRFLLGNKPELELLVGNYEKTTDPSALNPGKRCYARLGQAEHFRAETVAYLAAAPGCGFPASLPWAALARGIPKSAADPNDFTFLLDPKTTEMVLGEYRDVTPWTALESSQVDSLTFHTTKGTFTLKKVGTVWQAAGKSNLSVNTSAVTETLDALAKLKAERYVADRSDNLKPYGLDPAQLTIIIQTRTGGTYVLQVGTKDAASQHYYARVPQGNSTAVFLLGETDAGHIVRDLAAFTQTGFPSFPPPGR